MSLIVAPKAQSTSANGLRVLDDNATASTRQSLEIAEVIEFSGPRFNSLGLEARRLQKENRHSRMCQLLAAAEERKIRISRRPVVADEQTSSELT
jgi:hypothetical protein